MVHPEIWSMTKTWDRGVAVERWPPKLLIEVKIWLVEHFGVNGERWHEVYDYDLHTLYMDSDVYNWYILKWA